MMMILNAQSLIENGTDILGERMPVYFDTWLYGGQSPFGTYTTALFMLIFGKTLFGARLPMLLISIASIVAFYGFLKEVFKENTKLINVAYILYSIAPWHIAGVTYTFDCNYAPHIMMFAICFLAKAINSNRAKHYILSMIFFALCFYCYILSAVFVPLILAITYLLLIINKKISLKNIIISVVSVFIVSIPFILFGFVHLGFIKEFTLFGFSFSKMPYYQRSNEFQINNICEKLFEVIAIIALPDIRVLNNYAMICFAYGNLACGIFVIIGGLQIFISKKNKSNCLELGNFKFFAIPFIITALILLITVYSLFAPYRFFSFYYILIIFEAIGIIRISIFPRIKLKKLLAIICTLSLIVFSTEFVVRNSTNQINNNALFVESLDDALDFAFENDDKVGIMIVDKKATSLNYMYNQNTEIGIRYKYKDDDKMKNKFSSIKDNLLKLGPINTSSITSAPPLTTDNSLYYIVNDNKPINDKAIVILSIQIDKINYSKTEYKIKDFGLYSVLYK